MMGDFVHSLYVVKNVCDKYKSKANIYLTDNIHKYGHDTWRYGLEKSYNDLKSLISIQPYVNKFEILPSGFNQDFINLNEWRIYIENERIKNLGYTMCWSEFLCNTYGLSVKNEYKWLEADRIKKYENKIIIHRSLNRHNPLFNWKKILNELKDDIVFVTHSPEEYNKFYAEVQDYRVKYKLLFNIKEMADIIYSCKYFIGNQSMPFSLACGLNKHRMVELYGDSCKFYMGEEKYSDKISWFLSVKEKLNREIIC